MEFILNEIAKYYNINADLIINKNISEKQIIETRRVFIYCMKSVGWSSGKLSLKLHTSKRNVQRAFKKFINSDSFINNLNLITFCTEIIGKFNENLKKDLKDGNDEKEI